MGDIRFGAPYEKVRESADRAGTIHALPDDEVIAALAGAVMEGDGLLTNVLATDAMNRANRATTVLACMEEGALATDAAGLVRYANRAALDFLGARPTAALGEPLHALLEPLDAQGARIPERRWRALDAMRTGAHVQRDDESFHGAHRAIPVSYSIAPILKEGRVEGLVMTFRDITARRQAERAIEESRDLLQGTLDALSASIVILAGDGRILATNAAWRRFGDENALAMPRYGLGESYLDTCETAVGEGSRVAHMVAEAIREVAAGQRHEFVVEYPCHSPTEKRWFIARVTRFAGEGPARVVVSHEDITARVLAEQRLAERVGGGGEGSSTGMGAGD